MLSRNIRRASILSRLRKEEKKAVFLAVLIGKAEQRPTKLEVKASFFHWLRVSNYYKSIEKFKIAQDLYSKLLLKGKRKMLIQGFKAFLIDHKQQKKLTQHQNLRIKSFYKFHRMIFLFQKQQNFVTKKYFQKYQSQVERLRNQKKLMDIQAQFNYIKQFLLYSQDFQKDQKVDLFSNDGNNVFSAASSAGTFDKLAQTKLLKILQSNKDAFKELQEKIDNSAVSLSFFEKCLKEKIQIQEQKHEPLEDLPQQQVNKKVQSIKKISALLNSKSRVNKQKLKIFRVWNQKRLKAQIEGLLEQMEIGSINQQKACLASLVQIMKRKYLHAFTLWYEITFREKNKSSNSTPANILSRKFDSRRPNNFPNQHSQVHQSQQLGFSNVRDLAKRQLINHRNKSSDRNAERQSKMNSVGTAAYNKRTSLNYSQGARHQNTKSTVVDGMKQKLTLQPQVQEQMSKAAFLIVKRIGYLADLDQVISNKNQPIQTWTVSFNQKRNYDAQFFLLQRLLLRIGFRKLRAKTFKKKEAVKKLATFLSQSTQIRKQAVLYKLFVYMQKIVNDGKNSHIIMQNSKIQDYKKSLLKLQKLDTQLLQKKKLKFFLAWNLIIRLQGYSFRQSLALRPRDLQEEKILNFSRFLAKLKVVNLLGKSREEIKYGNNLEKAFMSRAFEIWREILIQKDNSSKKKRVAMRLKFYLTRQLDFKLHQSFQKWQNFCQRIEKEELFQQQQNLDAKVIKNQALIAKELESNTLAKTQYLSQARAQKALFLVVDRRQEENQMEVVKMVRRRFEQWASVAQTKCYYSERVAALKEFDICLEEKVELE